MRTRVFAYKGMIGIESSPDSEGLLNDPMKAGQLGFVLNAEFVDIQPAALKILKMIRPSGDDIGDVDIYQANDCVVFSWLGGPKKMVNPATVEGSAMYNPSLIKRTVKFQTPEDFMKFVDKHNVPKKKES